MKVKEPLEKVGAALDNNKARDEEVGNNEEDDADVDTVDDDDDVNGEGEEEEAREERPMVLDLLEPPALRCC